MWEKRTNSFGIIHIVTFLISMFYYYSHVLAIQCDNAFYWPLFFGRSLLVISKYDLVDITYYYLLNFFSSDIIFWQKISRFLSYLSWLKKTIFMRVWQSIHIDSIHIYMFALCDFVFKLYFSYFNQHQYFSIHPFEFQIYTNYCFFLIDLAVYAVTNITFMHMSILLVFVI